MTCCFISPAQRGVNFCRGENVTGVTTHEQMNYTSSPVLFHLGRDPGEKYPIRYNKLEKGSVQGSSPFFGEYSATVP